MSRKGKRKSPHIWCHSLAVETALKMGYRIESFSPMDVIVKHQKTGSEVTVPCADHPSKKWTGAAWQRVSEALVQGATDAQVRD